MNSFVLELWDDEGAACTFYTVRWDGDETNETDRFFEQFADNPEYEEATQILLTFVLRAIGERHGPKKSLLNRAENEVVGLPVKGFANLDSY